MLKILLGNGCIVYGGVVCRGTWPGLALLEGTDRKTHPGLRPLFATVTFPLLASPTLHDTSSFCVFLKALNVLLSPLGYIFEVMF